MKVKITKCRASSYWYADQLGQEFEVESYKYEKDHYKVIGTDGYILLEDCEIVQEDEYLTWKEGDTIVSKSSELKIEGFFKEYIIFKNNAEALIVSVHTNKELFNLGFRLKKERESGFYMVVFGQYKTIAEYFAEKKQWNIIGSETDLYDSEFFSINESKIEW